jgi:cell wall-associated NlpC family hydrolase
LRAKTLVALGFTTFGLACAPAIAVASSGGASTPSAKAPAATQSDAPAPAPQTPPAAGGGAAFGAIPFMLHPTVPGTVGVIKDGVGYAPTGAPLAVQRAIWAADKLLHQPYVYGGGHQSFISHGYDCSGTVSYALHGAGLLKAPLDSSDFMAWGKRGRGAWITIYTNPGHAWAVIAGMRLDTAGPGQSGPRWRTEKGSTRGFRARHPDSL